MFFKRKESFFLDLGNGSGQSEGPGQVDAAPVAVQVAAPQQPVASAPAPAASSKPMLTTAEAIAAELRAAQESRPAPSQATFAPDCLNPANPIPSRRRTAGANLAGFKAMAAGLFKS
jgi:hypothetical protein